MNGWAIFFITAISLSIVSYAFWELLFRPQHVKNEVVKEPEQLKDLIETYSEDYKFQVHNVSNLEQPYANVMYLIKYKKSFRKPRDVKEISREVTHIDYYTKL